MAQTLSNEDTQKISDLIKINIADEEIPGYAEQLNTVLDAVPVLQELDTEDVEITAQTHGLTNVLREDKPEPGLDINEYPNTQNLESGSFVVERVL